MKRGGQICLFLLMFVFLSSFASAAESGLLIDYVKFDTIKANAPLNLSVHVYNISNGLEVITANCTIRIYNQTGFENINRSLTYVSGSYNIFIGAGNFTKGTNSLLLQCQTAELGGVASGTFEVTTTGFKLSTGEALLYFLSAIVVIFIFLFLVYLIVTLPWKNGRDEEGRIVSVNKVKYVKIMLVPIAWLFMIWILNLLLGLSDFLSLTMYSGLFGFLVNFMVRLSWPVLIISVIVFITILMREVKIMDNLKRGIRNMR